ncbi:MAG: ribose-phosphate pyrophosphokinase [Candidatus Dadabacteria bacterium]|nr:MAG: ribose-phosphate pyrophosphokinase [Candidatus Dadabacteria bacterium]
MERQLVVISGRSNPRLTQQICEVLNVEIGRMEVLRFSDNELSVEIEDNVRGRDVFVVQSTSNPGNDHLMELLIAIDALKRASAWRITAVLPYFGYARQDRKLKPRVPVTAKLVADLLTTAGANRVLTMDLHAGQIMGFFNIPVDNLNAYPITIPYIREKYGDQDLTIVAPDVGGVERARHFATRLDNASIAIIDKRRSGPNQVAEMNVVGQVSGRTCIIVDDMIDTGGTLVKATESLLENGAAKVIACCVHPVFSGNIDERLQNSALEEVVVCDTIVIPRSFRYDKLTVLSVAPLFAEAIRRIHSEDSISSLFK